MEPTIDAFQLATECADAIIFAFSESDDELEARRLELARVFMGVLGRHEGEKIT